MSTKLVKHKVYYIDTIFPLGRMSMTGQGLSIFYLMDILKNLEIIHSFDIGSSVINASITILCEVDDLDADYVLT